MPWIRTLAGLLVVLLPACSKPAPQQQMSAGKPSAGPEQRAAQHPAPADAQQRYVIEGDAAAAVADPSVGAADAVLSRIGPDGEPGQREQIAKVQVERGGKFRMEGRVDWISMATVSVMTADVDTKHDSKKHDPGTRLGSALIVLEPGTTRIVVSDVAPAVHGGKYSQALIEPLLNDPAYMAAFQKAQRGIDENLPEAKKQQAESDLNRAKALEILNAHFSPLQKSPDPLMRFLAMSYADHPWGKWELSDREPLLALQKEMPGYPGVARTINGLQPLITAAALTPGKTMPDFTAQDINGKTFHLSEVFKQHRYVLVDLWASWCGPCREEMPHLKKAYAVFHPKGFEIVSFSLDDKDKAWRKASAEEKLPWINTSDLKAFSSPVAQLFGLSTIPASFLVDNQGNIIAMSLRGEQLKKKLTALLGP